MAALKRGVVAGPVPPPNGQAHAAPAGTTTPPKATPPKPAPLDPTLRSNHALREQAIGRMLDTAVRLIAARGASRLSLVDVGREAGYSHALPNYYFRSKTRLLLQVYQFITRKAGEVSARMIRRRWPGLRPSGLDSLEATIRSYFAMAASDASGSRVMNVLWAESYSSLPALQEVVRPLNLRLIDRFEAELRSAMQSGELDPAVDVAAVAVVVLGLMRGVVGQHLLDPSRVDLAQVADTVVLLLRRGLAPPAARPAPPPPPSASTDRYPDIGP